MLVHGPLDQQDLGRAGSLSQHHRDGCLLVLAFEGGLGAMPGELSTNVLDVHAFSLAAKAIESMRLVAARRAG